MTKSATATLGLGIVKKPATVEKGTAAPSPILTSDTVVSTLPETIGLPTASPLVESVNEPIEFLAMKNISVKVDIVTYKKLKKHGGDMGGKTNQAIFTEALALYFTKYGVK